ncbi:MAG: hypothetical protein ACI9DK_000510 [Vicingaceae bacterium]|jgi:hypothetical protein
MEGVNYNAYFGVTKVQFDRKKEELYAKYEQNKYTTYFFVVIGMKPTAQLVKGKTTTNQRLSTIIPELKSYPYISFTGKLIDNDQHFLVTRSNAAEITEKHAYRVH